MNYTGFPSIDKPWLKYYSEEDFDITIPTCNIYQNIYELNKEYSENVAIMYFNNRIKYEELFSSTEICARALRSIGIQRGDCVTLCSAAVPEAIYLVLACSRIGAIANFLNPLFNKEQLLERINESESRWLFVLDAMFSYVKDSLENSCIENVVIIPVTNSFSPFLAKVLGHNYRTRKLIKNGNGIQKFIHWNDFCDYSLSFANEPDVSFQPDTPVIMVYSSGSTGASKGILLTNEGINATIANYTISNMHIDRGDTFLQMIPVWFSTGIVISVLMPLAKGAIVIPEPKFSKETFQRDLKRYRPSVTLAATSLWLYVVNTNEKIDFSNMKYPTSGGEKILPLDELRINDYLKSNGCKTRLYKGYGMCELGSEICGDNDAPGYQGKLGGCGYPILNVIVSVFSLDTDKELKYGEHGEIRVISPARMKAYFKNNTATESFFKTDDQGRVWGCTGDIGYLDEDGELFVLGRTNDCCIRGDQKVYLFDIEEKIFDIEAINQCKVIDTEIDGEECLVAHIVLRSENADESDILRTIHNHLKDTLPDYMIPRYYKIRKTMPVHTNGKRDVAALRNDIDKLVEIIQS